MAEGILFTVAGEILMKLSSQASQRLGMLCGLNDDLAKLNSNVSAIQAVLLDAEERPTKSRFLKDWLEKLGEALYDADDVLDEFSSEALRRELMTRGKNAKQVRIFFSRSNQLAFNYRMTHEVKKIRERLDVISAEKNNFHLNEISELRIQNDLSRQIGTKRETHSSLSGEEVIGRDEDKMRLKSLLLDMNVKDNVSFIAIVGMGGIGKTTLAKFLYNDSEVSDCFELKMWVWVSEQFDVKIVVEKIIESATGCKPNVQEMDPLHVELQKVIQGKKYLLVMDDIWNESEEEWRKLKNLLMVGARGSKIMITKRDSKIAAEVERMTKLFTVEALGDSSSWSLFRDVAFKEGRELANPNLIQLGKEILVGCGGIPLIIRHIGRLLYSKTSEEEWMSFKNNELLGVTEKQNNEIHPMSILELSYNHLPPHLKQCFAYSSLFSKRKKIEINELIRQWVGQGFIKSSNGNKSMEDTGKDYFKELCWRFFYENSSGECDLNGFVCMHDVMRELARKVAGKQLYIRGNPNNDYVVSEQTRHISFDYKIKSWRDVLSKLRKAKGLRTFLLLHSGYKNRNLVNMTMLDEPFSSFPRLRVLGLDDSDISTLPDSIKKLRHLRYLDLSQNGIKLLPNSIIALQNLQTLKLMDCELKELPRDTSKLVNLRHLVIPPYMRLTHMPKGMEKLTCLQTISLFVFDCKRSNKLSELNKLNNLKGHLRITGLEQLRSTPSKAISVNLKDKRDLRYLTLEWKLLSQDESEAEADKTVMEGLEPHPNIESLKIYRYSGAGLLPNWVSACSLSKLTEIRIANCHRLQHLPEFNHLKAFKTLYLKDLRCIKFIEKEKEKDHDPYSSSSMFFPSLLYLWLEEMPNLEGWWELGDSKNSNKWLTPTFPVLRNLEIYHCPKLTSIPKLCSARARVVLCDVGVQIVSIIGPLSCLRYLRLEEIKDLKHLPEEFQQNKVCLGTSTMSSSPMGLRWLQIEECPNLMSLPEWIGILTSLPELRIIKCPKLKSLPKGMRELKSLQRLYIEDCPELEQRCKKGGEDWPNISHVPEITLSIPQSSSEAVAAIWRKTKDSITNICSLSLTPGYEDSEF